MYYFKQITITEYFNIGTSEISDIMGNYDVEAKTDESILTVTSNSWIFSQEIRCEVNWAKPADSNIVSARTFTVDPSFGTWMSEKTSLNAEKDAVMECFVWGIAEKTITVEWFKDDDTTAIIETANEVSSSGPPSF